MRIHVLGASGSGSTTLGQALAAALDVPHFDSDEYYWLPTQPPFTTKRVPEQRVAMLVRDLETHPGWCLSGSLCGWGDALISRFTHVVFTHLSPELRMQRLSLREHQRFGAAIEPGGDMHGQHLDFMAWARRYDSAEPPLRSVRLHDRWLAALPCPVIRIDTARPLTAIVEHVMRMLSPPDDTRGHSMPPTPTDNRPESWHRYFAIECNNRAWDLSTSSRSASEDEEMLNAAHAAALHWQIVGTELNHMRAKMLLAEVHSALGLGASAFAYAAEIKPFFLDRDSPDWEIAFTHAIYAHATHAAGKHPEHRSAYADALAAIDAIADPTDRDIVMKTFEHVPAP